MSNSIADIKTFLSKLGKAASAPKAANGLRAWTKKAKQSLGQMMHDQKSPNGSPYAPLSPRTIAEKGHDKILFDTHALYESVANNGSGHIEEVTDTTVTLGTSHEKKGRPVAKKLQDGDPSRNLPARPFIGVTDEMANQAAEMVADDFIDQLLGF